MKVTLKIAFAEYCSTVLIDDAGLSGSATGVARAAAEAISLQKGVSRVELIAGDLCWSFSDGLCGSAEQVASEPK